MNSFDLATVLAALALTYGITAWAYVRLRRSAVRAREVDFKYEQLQLARQQHADVMQVRQEQTRTLGHAPHSLGRSSTPKGGGTVQ